MEKYQPWLGEDSSECNSTGFAYDGQMGFEDVDAGASPAVTDCAIGARGIDRLAKTSGGTTSVGYPIYDGHGNMVSTLSECGASYSTGNGRQYDAWGNILNANGSGEPKGRYCANLGHKQDDESGLIYMRARYEDPRAGRFVSEDPARKGANWLAYASNDPVNLIDFSGQTEQPTWWYFLMSLMALVSEALAAVCYTALMNTLKEYMMEWTLSSGLWAAGLGFFYVLGIWAGADAIQSYVTALLEAGYGAAVAGQGDQVIRIGMEMQASPALAPLGYELQIYAMFGEIDSGNY